MELTPKQETDIASIRYFIPEVYRAVPITEDDIAAFLEKSERGVGPDIDLNYNPTGYQALMQGKRWREWHMRSWEQTVLEGTIPYVSLLFDDEIMPRAVIDYMKKSMFGGIDAPIIEKCYERGLQQVQTV